MRKAGSIGIILLLFLSALSTISFSATAGLLTIVTAEADNMVEVDVSPGSTGTVSIKATITCTNYNTITPLIVSLNAESSAGQATLDKPQLVFQGSYQSEDVDISIQLPIITTSAMDDQTCTLSGTWEQGGTTGSVQEDTTKIIVLPYYRCVVYSTQPHEETIQREGAFFNLTIENTGNSNDEYRLDIENRDELEALNFSIPRLSKIPIEEGDLRIVQLFVGTCYQTHVGDYEIHVTVTSVGSEKNEEEVVSDSYTLILTVNNVASLNENPQDEIAEILFDPLFIIIISIMAIVGFISLGIKRGMKNRNPT